MTQRDDVIALFAERGAGSIDHPGGNLLDHLLRTSDTLERWQAPGLVMLAGAAHAAYGIDGFPTALFRLDERNLVAEVIGEQAEEIVYRYASCDRAFTLPQIGRTEVNFRDRFTGAVDPAGPAIVGPFAELSFANELDIIRHSEVFRRDNGPAIAAMFAQWRDVVSPPAWDEYTRLLAPELPTTAE